MAELEKYFVYSVATVLQIAARTADLVTVWLLANYHLKQIPQTWKDDPL